MRWKERVRALRDEAYALYLAGRDPRTPRGAKILVACVVAYALSPVDLIPDFIPFLGHLDDLVLVPLGIVLAVRLIPPQVWADARERARGVPGRPQRGFVVATIVVAIWLVAATFCIVYGVRVLGPFR